MKHVSSEAIAQSALRQIDAGVDPAEAWATTLTAAVAREERKEAGERRHGSKR